MNNMSLAIKWRGKILSLLLALAVLPLILSSCGEGKSHVDAAVNDSTLTGNATSQTTTPPAAPAGVVATAGNGEVTVSWEPVADATSYNIYYLTYPGVTTANSRQRTGAASGEPITGLTNTTTYYFIVTALNEVGESVPSSEVSAKPMPYLPGIPGNFKLEGGLGEATLSWQAVPYATSYNVYYGDSPGLTTYSNYIKKLPSYVTSLKIDDLDKAPGHYYFIVTAVNKSGEGPPSVVRAAVAKSAYKAVSAGYGHSLALRIIEPTLKVEEGTVWMWGDNSSGQLGTGGTPLENHTAAMVPTLASVTNISAGYHHTIALKTDNSVMNWGLNNKGQLGDNHTTTNSNVPMDPYAPDAMTAIAGGYQHSVALKDDGTVWSWGYNLLGALGYASINCENPGDFNQPLAWSCSYTPTQVAGITGSAIAIAAGFDHTLAVANDGTVWSWGRNDTGQLGTTMASCPSSITQVPPTDVDFDLSASSCSTTPIQITNIPGAITAVTAGTRHSVALMSDGTVWAWGGNHYGQLGYTAIENCVITSALQMTCSYTPQQVPGLDHIISISAGSDHTVALKNDGTVWTWGYNGTGQLGNGAPLGETPNQTPAQVTGLSGITAVAAGAYHSLALKNDGTVWAWGYNGHGQLGNDSLTDSAVPVQVKGLLGPVVVIPGM